MVTSQFKFTTIQIPTIQILMRSYFKNCLKLKKIKTCHTEEINKDYDAEKKRLLKDIMHN